MRHQYRNVFWTFIRVNIINSIITTAASQFTYREFPRSYSFSLPVPPPLTQNGEAKKEPWRIHRNKKIIMTSPTTADRVIERATKKNPLAPPISPSQRFEKIRYFLSSLSDRFPAADAHGEQEEISDSWNKILSKIFSLAHLAQGFTGLHGFWTAADIFRVVSLLGCPKVRSKLGEFLVKRSCTIALIIQRYRSIAIHFG